MIISIVLIILTIIFLWLLFFVCNDADDGLVLGVIALIMAVFAFFVSIEDLIGIVIVISGLFLTGNIFIVVWTRRS